MVNVFTINKDTNQTLLETKLVAENKSRESELD